MFANQSVLKSASVRLVMAALVIFLLPLSALHAEGDAGKGKKVFNKCKTCHSLEDGKNKIGPHLFGMFGRTAGAVEGFKYSDAMKDSGVVWDDETLDALITKPKDFMPGTKMAYSGLKKETQRQDLIAFLKEATQ